MITIRLSQVDRLRVEGQAEYADELLRLGIVSGPRLSIHNADLETLVAKYTPERLPPKQETPKPFGLGDLVHSFAVPIAWSLDRVLGTNLTNCGSCAERRARLNRL